MTPKKETRGGARPGAGRPKGTGKGKTVITCSVSMSPADWEELDADRGKHSRGRWISGLMKFWKDRR